MAQKDSEDITATTISWPDPSRPIISIQPDEGPGSIGGSDGQPEGNGAPTDGAAPRSVSNGSHER